VALLLAYEEVADLAAFLALENRIVQTYIFYLFLRCPRDSMILVDRRIEYLPHVAASSTRGC
jgi:hypothetical protein